MGQCPRVDKHVSKTALLAKFHYHPFCEKQTVPIPSQKSDDSDSKATSDDEKPRSTSPLTSPLRVEDQNTPHPVTITLEGIQEQNTTTPYENHVTDAPIEILKELLPGRLNKGKGKELMKNVHKRPTIGEENGQTPRFNARLEHLINLSDSDLEIEESKESNTSKKNMPHLSDNGSSSEKVFQRIIGVSSIRPRSNSLLHCSPRESKAISKKDHDRELRQKIASQITLNRQTRESELKARGIDVITAEERMKEAVEVENIVEKARLEAAEIREKEKAATKTGGAAEDAYDDSDYESEWNEFNDDQDDSDIEEEQSQSEAPDVELSGSEDDDHMENDQVDNSEPHEIELQVQGFGSTSVTLEPETNLNPLEEEDDVHNFQRNPKRSRVVEDDEDDQPEDQTVQIQVPTVLQSAVETSERPDFGIDVNIDLGWSQMFANSNSKEDTPDAADRGLMDTLRKVGAYSLPTQKSGMQDGQPSIAEHQWSPELLRSNFGENVPNTYSRNPGSIVTNPLSYDINAFTQQSDFPDPTPDCHAEFSTAPPRFERTQSLLTDPKSVDGSRVSQTPPQKRERLYQISTDPMDVVESSIPKPSKSRPRKADASEYDNGVSGMFEEQAQESDDEYAGLGGISDEDDEEVQDGELDHLIDNSLVQASESELAAFYA